VAAPQLSPAVAACDTARLQAIGRAATVALYDELALYPKPGLVSFIDTGSHTDMDAGTFLRSLFALRHYFVRVTEAGALHRPFAALEQLGLAAEARMLQATGGVNTHRGAIFNLGMLCAAAGRLHAEGTAPTPTPARLRAALLDGWGEALRRRCDHSGTSNGQRAARQLGLRSAGDEAARGMPVLFEVAVPALQAARTAGLAPRDARLQTFFHTMAALDDTNLAHRGGLAGLRDAQRLARDYLADGGVCQPGAIERAEAIHRHFVARRLSPGGSADLLAAAGWVLRLSAGASEAP
jgi:triphosphoribosyl-dephospho-CoA synthase